MIKKLINSSHYESFNLMTFFNLTINVHLLSYCLPHNKASKMSGFHWFVLLAAIVAAVAVESVDVEAVNATATAELGATANVTEFGESDRKESIYRSKWRRDEDEDEDEDDDDEDKYRDDDDDEDNRSTRKFRSSRIDDDNDDNDDHDDEKNNRRRRPSRRDRDGDNNSGRTPEFKHCGGNAIRLHVHKFPNPLLLREGERLNMAFSAVITETLPEPIYARISIRKKVLGLWNRIPCVGRVGSCEYEVTCDKIRKQYGGRINQECPPPVGKTQREFTFTMPRIPRIVRNFASGTYKIQAELFTKKKKRGELLACSETQVRVQT